MAAKEYIQTHYWAVATGNLRKLKLINKSEICLLWYSADTGYFDFEVFLNHGIQFNEIRRRSFKRNALIHGSTFIMPYLASFEKKSWNETA